MGGFGEAERFDDADELTLLFHFGEDLVELVSEGAVVFAEPEAVTAWLSLVGELFGDFDAVEVGLGGEVGEGDGGEGCGVGAAGLDRVEQVGGVVEPSDMAGWDAGFGGLGGFYGSGEDSQPQLGLGCDVFVTSDGVRVSFGDEEGLLNAVVGIGEEDLLQRSGVMNMPAAMRSKRPSWSPETSEPKGVDIPSKPTALLLRAETSCSGDRCRSLVSPIPRLKGSPGGILPTTVNRPGELGG